MSCYLLPVVSRGFVPSNGWISCSISALFCALTACSSDPDPKETLDGGSGPGPNSEDGGDGGCADDDGFIPSCTAIGGSVEAECDRETCDRYVRRMKTRLARLAIQCMKEHIAAGDSCRPCSAEVLVDTCSDSNAQAACESLVKTCPARRVEECVPLISGLTFGGRLNFVTCATNDNCLHDLPSCLP